MTIAAQPKIVKTETARIHAQMVIHVTRQPNVELKIIVPFALAHLVWLAIHLSVASLKELNQDRNARATVTVHRQRRVSIKLAEIHALNGIHAV